MATWKTIEFQDANSPMMEQLSFFHDQALMILTMISILVGYVVFNMITNKMTDRYMLEDNTIEVIWTVLPAVLLVFIALPSLRILYMMKEYINSVMTIKTIGHQWYWNYEYSDFMNAEFDSYMIPTSDLPEDGFRLLDVDNRVVVPMNAKIRMLATSADVIHSWAMPSLGVKVDATPGRLNQVSCMSTDDGRKTETSLLNSIKFCELDKMKKCLLNKCYYLKTNILMDKTHYINAEFINTLPQMMNSLRTNSVMFKKSIGQTETSGGSSPNFWGGTLDI